MGRGGRLGAAWLVLTTVAACSSAGSAGGTGSTSTSSSIAVRGAVQLVGQGGNFASDATTLRCHGVGTYRDVRAGGRVVISTDSGRRLTTAALAAGSIDLPGQCGFRFTTTVPSGERYYDVRIGSHATIKFAEASMTHPRLTVGT